MEKVVMSNTIPALHLCLSWSTWSQFCSLKNNFLTQWYLMRCLKPMILSESLSSLLVKTLHSHLDELGMNTHSELRSTRLAILRGVMLNITTIFLPFWTQWQAENDGNLPGKQEKPNNNEHCWGHRWCTTGGICNTSSPA